MSVYEPALRSPFVYLTRSQCPLLAFSGVLSKGQNRMSERPVTGRLHSTLKARS